MPDLTRFKNIEILYCEDNELTSLPTLPQNLQKLYCYSNNLTSLPSLSKNLEELTCYNNTIFEIVDNNSYSLFEIK